ncbi:DUF2268 domain-containing protein [Bacillus sp. EAC]|uniref:DUF2268 domain-containing protein n=1 Tax=Bacillus sp. EAC TaxID=1978338 RepID=UPI000B43C8AF|nr:DUF2268 domain-containing putative Zn-dependent protease [Bacillus sp. EAC]
MPTYKWIDIIEDKKSIMKKLLPYFPNYDEQSLYTYLLSHGLSKLSKDSKNDFKLLIKNNVWKSLQTEFNKIKKEFNGPDVPIFIFPCQQARGMFLNSTYQRGGLAYKNCICLFLSPLEGILQHKAVLLHEYHHIVRLTKFYKNKKVTLLDAMILEGLAEHAVLERYGEEVQAPWTKLYSTRQCEYYYNKYLKDHLELPSNDEDFSKYLYGGNGIPKLLGYGVGYDIVKNCLEQTEWSNDRLMRTSSKKIKDNAINYISL